MNTVLLTGAAGGLGRVLGPPLREVCRTLRLSDLPVPLAALDEPAAVPCDLADDAAVHRLLQGVDAVVHLGGVSVEGPFEPIMQANVRGAHNLYEAARRNGTKRIVLASSGHVTGCYEQSHRTHPADPPRPDGNYGLSKLFGEGLGRLYWDRYGIETVCLRIGTAPRTDRPPDRNALATWLSHGDLARLVIASLTAPDVGFLIAYGMSNNSWAWWDTREAWASLGYEPVDSAEAFAEDVASLVFPSDTPMARLQGGSFLGMGPFDQSGDPASRLPARIRRVMRVLQR